ncbi:NOP58 family protein [Candidatus Woesearchaeota archaeon]|nr:NOP58 family protein [Candidatus Woesearchaeota archaeon]
MATAPRYRFNHLSGAYAVAGDGSIVGADGVRGTEGLPPLPEGHLREFLAALRSQVPAHRFRTTNTAQTRRAIKGHHYDDILLIHAAHLLEEIDKAMGLLGKRLAEWYAITLPELVEAIPAAETLAKRIAGSSRSELLASLGMDDSSSLGVGLPEADDRAVRSLAEVIVSLADVKRCQAEYIKTGMERLYPNYTRLAGAAVGARLLAHAGSFAAIVRMTASKLQMLGAEKALFRHMRTKAPPPKHGLISQHPLVSGAKRGDKGRAARMLADKIVIAARVDYFKGTYVADRLYEELEVKLCRS